jgi:hypothetical protein
MDQPDAAATAAPAEGGRELSPPVAPAELQPATTEPPPAVPPTTADSAASPAASEAAAPADAGKGKKNKRKRRREIQPPARRCSACAEFLANRKTQEIPCTQCATPIFWPPESQLQTHLGNWAAPSLCGACKLVQVQAAREAAREILRHSHPQPGESAPATEKPPANEPERPAEG